MFFIRGDLGGLFLSGTEAKDYSKCLFLLLSIVDEDLINRNTVEENLQMTILKVLDINKAQNEITFAERLTIEIKELRKKLKTSPKCFAVHFQIQGLKDEGLPYKFGNVEFCKFDEAQLSKFTTIILAYKGEESEIKKHEEFANSLREDTIYGKSIAIVEKMALDPIAARFNAAKEIALTIDVINFFSDLIPNQNGFLYQPGEFEYLKISVPIISKEDHPSFIFKNETTGWNMPFSFPILLELDEKHHLNITKVSSLLSKKTNDIESRLISAMQWAGKASVKKKKEEAFLLYAISLESLVLLDNEKEELTDRLSTRVAFLLGNNLSNRKEIKEAVKELYGIRSKIVHSGNYQVTNTDLNTIIVYAKSCIFRILNEAPFITMSNKKDFVNWFTEMMFR